MRDHGRANDLRALSGMRAYLGGLSAEEAVARHYCAQNAVMREKRWRGQAGEIDLIFEQSGTIIFCEVKKAHSHDIAAMQLRPQQAMRIFNAGAEYLMHLPDGELTPTRFELAVVDHYGVIKIISFNFDY